MLTPIEDLGFSQDVEEDDGEWNDLERDLSSFTLSNDLLKLAGGANTQLQQGALRASAHYEGFCRMGKRQVCRHSICGFAQRSEQQPLLQRHRAEAGRRNLLGFNPRRRRRGGLVSDALGYDYTSINP